MGELNSKNRKREAGRGRLVCSQSAHAKTVLARCAQVQSPPPRLPGVKSKFNSREKGEENYKERPSYLVLAHSDRVCIELN